MRIYTSKEAWDKYIKSNVCNKIFTKNINTEEKPKTYMTYCVKLFTEADE